MVGDFPGRLTVSKFRDLPSGKLTNIANCKITILKFRNSTFNRPCSIAILVYQRGTEDFTKHVDSFDAQQMRRRTRKNATSNWANALIEEKTVGIPCMGCSPMFYGIDPKNKDDHDRFNSETWWYHVASYFQTNPLQKIDKLQKSMLVTL